MTETINAQIRAIRAEIQEILKWLDWATEVATRIETRSEQVDAMVAQSEPEALVEERPEGGDALALVEGVIAYNVTDFQAAVDAAGRAFWQRYGRPPTCVALPRGVDPASLKLWTLRLADPPAPPGTVIVGGDEESRGG
jgi:hypothetical protein